jgi:phosphoglycolate phosphatase
VERQQLLVAFDLDGTLIDSVGDLAASASALVTSLGGRALEQREVALMVGEGANVLVRKALAAGGVHPDTPGALARFLEIYDERLLDTTVPYEGVPEMLLLTSRRARLAVLTNKPIAPSRRILDALHLTPYFEAIVGGDSEFGRKPNIGGLRSLAVAAEHVVLVGDSPIDWQTSLAADCQFVWARYGFGADRFDRPPDTPYVIERASDFVAVLDRVCAIRSG